SVPETLQALIAARLDALDHEDRALITDAAVLGLSFTVPALQALSGVDADALNERLDGLVRRQVLILDADPLSSERGQYRFVQGVVREVAYQSLAKRDRRTKHVAAAASAGVASGSMTRQKVVKNPAPSIFAASSRSRGMVR